MTEPLRKHVRTAIARNALMFSPGLQTAARLGAIGAITKDMQQDPEFAGQHDVNDARRHAEWSRRMARVDPLFARAVGDLNEIVGSVRPYLPQRSSRPLEERVRIAAAAREMDLHNNAVGRRAAAAGAPIDRGDLQTRLQLAPQPRR